MKTTTDIIEMCFKKAKVKNDSPESIRLLKVLCFEMNKHFHKVKRNHEEKYLFELVMDGYVLSMGDYTIQASNGDISNKDLILSDRFQKKGFNTVKGAIKYLEENA